MVTSRRLFRVVGSPRNLFLLLLVFTIIDPKRGPLVGLAHSRIAFEEASIESIMPSGPFRSVEMRHANTLRRILARTQPYQTHFVLWTISEVEILFFG